MDGIKLLQGDCLELMKDIPAGSVDMVLCDLPYGVTQNKKDCCIPFVPLWEQYDRIVKENGAILLFGQGAFFVDLVNSNRKMFRYDLVWDKQLKSGFLNANRMPLRQHEQIAVFYKRMPSFYPQFSSGKPLHSKGTSYQGKEATNRNYGNFKNADDARAGCTDKYPSSIISVAKPHPSIAKHRTEKPVFLLEYLIRSYSSCGDTILDNCMGSGSTGVACVNAGRRFIGMELDRNYFDIAVKRIAETEKALTI